MKRFVLSAPPEADGRIRLYEKDYHYLVRVRRLTSGMYFDAVLPGGEETRIRILSTENKTLTGECLEALEQVSAKQVSQERVPSKRVSASGATLPPIALFQSLPKGAKMDLIVRQATEGGLSFIVPFQSEFSTAKFGKNSNEKIKRWERIIKEARQQSGSAIETEILSPCGFDALLQYWESLKKKYKRPIGILLHQDPLEKGTFHGYLDNSPDFVVLAVGPEGGFSPGELKLFLEAGFHPLIMGSNILRTETAALYGAAVIRIILLESEVWTAGRKGSFSSMPPLT